MYNRTNIRTYELTYVRVNVCTYERAYERTNVRKCVRTYVSWYVLIYALSPHIFFGKKSRLWNLTFTRASRP